MIQVCGAYGREGKCIQSLVGKTEGKRLLERPGRRWGVMMMMIMMMMIIIIIIIIIIYGSEINKWGRVGLN
jgi:hypothetical protein